MKLIHIARSVVAFTIVISTGLAPAAWAADQSPDADHVMVTPAELTWTDAPSLPPGAKVSLIEGQLDQPVPFTLRLQFPANYQLPAHWHPALEHTTVLSGAINMGVGDALDRTRTTALPTGSTTIMQPNTRHFLWTAEEATVQVHGVGPFGITYVNPADDPRTR